MLTFVTAYFCFDEKNDDFYFKQFHKLADLGFPIILFLDSQFIYEVEELKEKYSNIKILLFDWASVCDNLGLTCEKLDTLEIPNSNVKDNVRYLTLMNTKPYFLKHALAFTTAETLVWADFGIMKITNDVEHFKQNFTLVGQKVPTKIIIPGGIYESKLLNTVDLMRVVYWRFLGGIVICPRSLVNIFYTLHNDELGLLLNQNKITWEVNIWTNIEKKHPALIQHFRSDHNKTMFGFFDKKIILISMIKNEEKIIRRCIDSVSGFCDAFCINDTGSTDSTVEIVNDYIEKTRRVPCKLYINNWIDFGANRTLSYKNTVMYCEELGWDPNSTYGLLLDADMKLVVGNLSKQSLVENGYKILQENANLIYYNVRLVLLNDSWKCIGVTHEYWDGIAATLQKGQLYISDIGDGGCKDDKFTRDITLLRKGIETEPNNARYYFYLAQSLKDTQQFRESIAMYKKRIALGGWNEEVWYSHYMIAKCWAYLENIPKAEAWANKAYAFRKERAEPIYFLTNLFRKNGDNYKAYHYYLIGKKIPYPCDTLFVEKNVYNYLFDYEYTILQYWVSENRIQGLKKCIQYLNLEKKEHESNVYDNMEYYMIRLCSLGSYTPMNFPVLQNYTSSSPCIIDYKGRSLMNIRYVNYRIQPNGSYLMYNVDSLSEHNDVCTKNALSYTDSSGLYFFDNILKDIKARETRIKGLEDIRLFVYQDILYYIGSSKEYSYHDKIRMVMGMYDIESLTYKNNRCLYPPTETSCEKNWIPINHNDEEIYFIYNWYPLSIGSLVSDKLCINIKHETPQFFKHMRGSTCGVDYEGALWFLTHGVKYSIPRKYYHQFVVLEKDTYKPLSYSLPFYFNRFQIEYCIGLQIKGEATLLFSQNDSNTSSLSISMEEIKKLMLTI